MSQAFEVLSDPEKRKVRSSRFSCVYISPTRAIRTESLTNSTTHTHGRQQVYDAYGEEGLKMGMGENGGPEAGAGAGGGAGPFGAGGMPEGFPVRGVACLVLIVAWRTHVWMRLGKVWINQSIKFPYAPLACAH